MSLARYLLNLQVCYFLYEILTILHIFVDLCIIYLERMFAANKNLD